MERSETDKAVSRCASSRYLGASTPFGVITWVDDYVYNPAVVCTDKEGSETVRQLPHLIALGHLVQVHRRDLNRSLNDANCIASCDEICYN